MHVTVKKMRYVFPGPMRICIPFALVVVILVSFVVLMTAGVSAQEDGVPVYRADSRITRLTFSGSNWVGYPSLSDDGRMVAFMEEIRDTSSIMGVTRIKRMIKVIPSDGSPAQVLFTDSTLHAPAPYEDSFFLVGTKPPLISGNGQKVVFALSLTEPADMKDHYVGVVSTDGTGFTAFELRNESLSAVDWEKERFKSDAWERVAVYAISDDGHRIACVVKGHFGPVAYGNPSGIIVVGADGSEQRTLMAPGFENDQWTWDGFPRKPLTGGGWAFALSGSGETLLYGAQSSENQSDYDLYVMNVPAARSKQVTSFHDRLFSFADISDTGERITFFYSGKKGEGIGTYVVDAEGTGLQRLTSVLGSRVDYDDVTGTGNTIVYKASGGAFAIDGVHRGETLLFSRGTPGYVRSEIEMDLPSYPSFWAPNLISTDGKTVLLTGVPVGKDVAELYILTVKDLKKALLICPRCRKNMDPSWTFCPYDGTKLE